MNVPSATLTARPPEAMASSAAEAIGLAPPSAGLAQLPLVGRQRTTWWFAQYNYDSEFVDIRKPPKVLQVKS